MNIYRVQRVRDSSRSIVPGRLLVTSQTAVDAAHPVEMRVATRPINFISR
jgi:hypothetical protein